MRILLINPPRPSIGSRIPHEHLPPLGLLAVGGPLRDAGHAVRLLDAEFGPMSLPAIVREACRYRPEAVLLGHSGSTTIHPTVVALSRALCRAMPDVRIVYGGVFSTYPWREILCGEPQIDVIVRSEGEATTLRLIEALEHDAPFAAVPGLALRKGGAPFATPPAPVIRNLDDYRIGWELIDLDRYSYWGDKKAVVVQLSRGCPHPCTYCGQNLFWTTGDIAIRGGWRPRSPGCTAFTASRSSTSRTRTPPPAARCGGSSWRR